MNEKNIKLYIEDELQIYTDNVQDNIINSMYRTLTTLINNNHLLTKVEKETIEYYFNNNNQNEIANLMHITQPTVHANIERAKNKINRIIAILAIYITYMGDI